MAVISVVITESQDQVVSGIPKVVSITANIPSSIFYTLDGTTPDLNSTIYVGPIFIPYNQLSVILSVFATNGTDSSPVIVETYSSQEGGCDVRLPHATTNIPANSVIPDAYPFGTPPLRFRQEYLSNSLAGTTVDDPNLPQIPNGFDGNGNPTTFTNKPYNTSNYQIVYDTTNAEGQQGPLIGNLPGTVDYPYKGSDIQPEEGPEFTEQFTTTFDPRAMVIFQDFRNEDPNDPPQINKQSFALGDQTRIRDGSIYFNSGIDGSPLQTTNYIRSAYNAREQTITHYYRDLDTNRWIISTSAYTPNYQTNASLPQQVVGRSSKVFQWVPFKRQTIF